MVQAAKKTVKRKKVKEVVFKLYDQRMLLLMDFVINNRVQEINRNYKFYKAIKLPPASITQILRGKQSFRLENIMEAINTFGVDARFFFEENHLVMFKTDRELSAPEQLIEATSRIINELKAKK